MVYALLSHHGGVDTQGDEEQNEDQQGDHRIDGNAIHGGQMMFDETEHELLGVRFGVLDIRP